MITTVLWCDCGSTELTDGPFSVLTLAASAAKAFVTTSFWPEPIEDEAVCITQRHSSRGRQHMLCHRVAMWYIVIVSVEAISRLLVARCVACGSTGRRQSATRS